MTGALWPLPVSSLLQNKPWGPPSHPPLWPFSTEQMVPPPLLFQRGVTAITRSPLLANSAVHNFDSVLFGSHDNFSALSVLPSQQQGLPSSVHLLHSLGICLLKPVSQPTPITEDRFQHELCLHPNPDKVVYVGQGLGDGFRLGFNYYSTSFKWRGGGGIWLWHS